MIQHTTDFARYTRSKKQYGVSVIEAIVAMLILSVLFLGLAHVVSRGLVGQRFLNTQNMTLLEMREVIQTTNVCSGSHSLTLISTISLDATCPNRSDVSISVGSVPAVALEGINLPPVITVSTSSNSTTENFFGGDGVIRISSN